MAPLETAALALLLYAAQPVGSQARSDDPEYAKKMAEQQDAYNKGTVKESIPDTYNAKTKLTATVEKGDNELNFDLTSDGTGGI